MVANPAVNFYQSIVAPSANASSSVSVSSTSADKASGSKFSDLLSSFSSERTARRDNTHERSSTDRTAQANNTSKSRTQHASTDRNSTTTRTTANQDTKVATADHSHVSTDQKITPEDAADLLNNFESVSDELSKDGVSLAAQAEVKTRLQAIVDSGEPESISDILASLGIDASVTAEAEVTTPDVPHLATQILSVLHKTTAKVCNIKDEALNETQATTQSVAANILSPALLALQAGLTSNDGTKVEASAEVTPNTDLAIDANAQTVVQITPLSAEFALVPSAETQSIVTAAATKTPAPSTPAVNTTIDAVIETPQAPDLDSLIPPLSTGEKKTELPDISLPKVGANAEAQIQSQPQAPATTAAPTFSQILQATGAEGQVLKATKEIETPDIKSDAVNAIGNVNGIPGLSGTITTQAVAPTAAVAAPNLINHAPVAEQVSVAITRASHEGIDHITIQLSPDDMGRVEVKMQMHQDGRAQIQFTVDKAETFDAISRDARSLERSLQESGIKADTGSMQFNLRQQPQPQSNLTGDGSYKQSSNTQGNETGSVKAAAAVTAPITKHYTLNLRDGVDIHA